MAQKIDSVLSIVTIRNRVSDGKVRITFNSKEYVWEPGETKQMPRDHAEWFRAKSLFRLNPGDLNEGIPASSEYKLSIVEDTPNEGDITKAYVENVQELLDVSNMPELMRVDPTTGKPMRRVYIDPRSTGAASTAIARERLEQTVKTKLSSAMIAEGANTMADIASKMSEEEFESVVEELPSEV